MVNGLDGLALLALDQIRLSTHGAAVPRVSGVISAKNILKGFVAREEQERMLLPPELPLYFNAAASPPSESLPGYESMIRHPIVPVAVSPAPNLPDVPHTIPITISNTNQGNTNRAGPNAQQSLPNLPTEQGPSPPYTDTAVNAPQSAARIHISTDVQSAESSQITVLMQRIDSMWAAIARLQQTQVERTAASAPAPVYRSSEISSPLPEYASVDDAFVEEGSTPRPR
ncbi:uncharacterized protein FOMMEDRAFT_156393 [Fomitiporia mediterranea MF3/22]|uniref:uncharacterized protein n=1 Tax=Fomitiporia mediterranea (strain MF3/22) TaxID=694068 RepID=UPI00044077A8|nr:uncharacterized protein FOMMEDRAFT_156393 [Fomitiporia mediterranea MF3/22]EJD03032.1 hypothetical protein FOMMEDRAFT_156393 [Fomitiporia mediterranea MF3/22]